MLLIWDSRNSIHTTLVFSSPYVSTGACTCFVPRNWINSVMRLEKHVCKFRHLIERNPLCASSSGYYKHRITPTFAMLPTSSIMIHTDKYAFLSYVCVVTRTISVNIRAYMYLYMHYHINLLRAYYHVLTHANVHVRRFAYSIKNYQFLKQIHDS